MTSSIIRRFVLPALACGFVVSNAHAQPRVIYTDASTLGVSDGSTWTTAFRDLQDAIAAAAADPLRTTRGVEIRIAQGVYTPDRGTLNPGASFNLPNNVSLVGGFGGLGRANPDERNPESFITVLSGDLARNDEPGLGNFSDNARTIVRTFAFNVLDGLQISGGNADGGGGPVIATNPSSTSSARLVIRGCSLVRNRSVSQPIFSLVKADLFQTHIAGNASTGASVVEGRDLSFNACRILSNQTLPLVPNSGIATVLLRSGSSPSPNIFNRTVVADNIGGAMGAIYAFETNLPIYIDGSTIANNAAPGAEAVASLASSIRIRNSVIAGNRRTTTPATHTQIGTFGPSTLDVDTTVLIDNGAAGIRQISFPGPLPAVMSGDPRFAAPSGPDLDPATWADNDYRLLPGSGAIDRADSSQARFTPVDLSGTPLFDDPNTPNVGLGPFAYADLGAFEYDGSTCPGDFNRSGTLDTLDIFAFLNAWFAGNLSADIDGSGALGPPDILEFITGWLIGC